MAALTVLPTYQRYVNGVPVPQKRNTLRLREKYIVLLVFVTFGTVCFGAFFFLPDLRDRVSVNGLRKDFANDVFLPKPVDVAPGRVIRHSPDEDVDEHQIGDQIKLGIKIKADKKREEIDAHMRQKLNISKGEHDKVKQEIEEDKNKIVKEKEEDIKKKAEEEKEKNLKEVKDHAGVAGGQGGVPSDEETKKRQDTVRNVSSLSLLV